MTVFLIVSALLLIGALLFIVPPLLRNPSAQGVSRKAVNITLYRDQIRELEVDLQSGTLNAEHYEKARRELEARLLEDVDTDDTAADRPRLGRASAIMLGLALPLCAVAIYLVAGSPQALVPGQGVDARGGPEHEVTAEQIEEMLQRLATRLQNNPDNVEGWTMLARSYNALGRFEQAASAYASAAKQSPNDAQLLADYADALAMAQGRLQGEPEKLIARALQIDPDNSKALALAGSLAFDNKNYARAVEYWEMALRLAPPDSEFARSVNASLAQARTLGKASVPAAPRSASTAAAAGSVKGVVKGVVKLAPELAAKVAPTDTVFIFARAAEGSRMPLAILRKQVHELPVTFLLDDSMAMAPGINLSSFPQVVVGARISKSANANPQPGDFQGLSAPIANSASGITVVIDSEVR